MGAPILIIDDDGDIRRSLELVLRSEGFDTRSAADGAAGLAVAVGECPSIILLDLMMPVMDGREFMERMRRVPALATVPVVLLSAYVREIEAHPVEGVAATLRKPFDIDPLLELIDRLTGPGH